MSGVSAPHRSRHDRLLAVVDGRWTVRTDSHRPQGNAVRRRWYIDKRPPGVVRAESAVTLVFRAGGSRISTLVECATCACRSPKRRGLCVLAGLPQPAQPKPDDDLNQPAVVLVFA